ncbi:hypothetical protein AB4144_31200, partial [Rhizobiaceae sp. 2RAB30]
ERDLVRTDHGILDARAGRITGLNRAPSILYKPSQASVKRLPIRVLNFRQRLDSIQRDGGQWTARLHPC